MKKSKTMDGVQTPYAILPPMLNNSKTVVNGGSMAATVIDKQHKQQKNAHNVIFKIFLIKKVS